MNVSFTRTQTLLQHFHPLCESLIHIIPVKVTPMCCKLKLSSLLLRETLYPWRLLAFVLPFSDRTLLWCGTKDYSRHHFMISVMKPFLPSFMLPKYVPLIPDVMSQQQHSHSLYCDMNFESSIRWAETTTTNSLRSASYSMNIMIEKVIQNNLSVCVYVCACVRARMCVRGLRKTDAPDRNRCKELLFFFYLFFYKIHWILWVYCVLV